MSCDWSHWTIVCSILFCVLVLGAGVAGAVVAEENDWGIVGVLFSIGSALLLANLVVLDYFLSTKDKNPDFKRGPPQALFAIVSVAVAGGILAGLAEEIYDSPGLLITGCAGLFFLGALIIANLLYWFSRFLFKIFKNYDHVQALLSVVIASAAELHVTVVIGFWGTLCLLLLPFIADEVNAPLAEPPIQFFTLVAMVAAAKAFSVLTRVFLSIDFVTRRLRPQLQRAFWAQLLIKLAGGAPQKSGALCDRVVASVARICCALENETREEFQKRRFQAMLQTAETMGFSNIHEWYRICRYMSEFDSEGNKIEKVSPTRPQSTQELNTEAEKTRAKQLASILYAKLQSRLPDMEESDRKRFEIFWVEEGLKCGLHRTIALAPRSSHRSIIAAPNNEPDNEVKARQKRQASYLWTQIIGKQGEECSEDDLKRALLRAFKHRRQLGSTIGDLRVALGRIDGIVFVAGLIVSLYAIVGIFRNDFLEMWVAISTLVVSFSFLFADAARVSLSNLIFLFLRAPFGIGDTIAFDGQRYNVRRITTLSTELLRWDGKIVSVPNLALSEAQTLINLTTTAYSRVEFEYPVVPAIATEDTVEKMKTSLAAFAKDAVLTAPNELDQAAPTTRKAFTGRVTVRVAGVMASEDKVMVRLLFRADTLAPIADSISDSLFLESTFRLKVAQIVAENLPSASGGVRTSEPAPEPAT